MNRSFAFGIAILIALCCAGVAQEVHTDHDKSANFERYHTYYWAKVQTSNPLWQQRIQDAVDKDLQAKGWQRSEGSGDVALTATLLTISRSIRPSTTAWVVGVGEALDLKPALPSRTIESGRLFSTCTTHRANGSCGGEPQPTPFPRNPKATRRSSTSQSTNFSSIFRLRNSIV